MRKDGRMWLPMHFAMSVPNIALDDIQTLFESDPNSISRECNSFLGFTPCQLTVMMKDPNLALFDRLNLYDPGFAARVNTAFRISTPLHLAADNSNSVVVIKELIRMYPAALIMKDINRDYPICTALGNKYPEAVDILQAFIDAAPHTARVGGINNPLYKLMCIQEHSKLDSSCTERMAAILLAACPGATSIASRNTLPVHIAAESGSTEVFKMILDATPARLLHTGTSKSKLVHGAMNGRNLDSLRHMISVMPEILLSADEQNRPLLHSALCRDSDSDCAFIHALVSLAPPDAAKILDSRNGNNLLHTFCGNQFFNTMIYNPIGLDFLRLLLRLIPGGALAINHLGQTPYEVLHPPSLNIYPDFHMCQARRILLLAGPRSLRPEMRQQLNYEARKYALLAFFGVRAEDRSGRVDIYYRIRHGVGARELMREIVSFL